MTFDILENIKSLRSIIIFCDLETEACSAYPKYLLLLQTAWFVISIHLFSLALFLFAVCNELYVFTALPWMQLKLSTSILFKPQGRPRFSYARADSVFFRRFPSHFLYCLWCSRNKMHLAKHLACLCFPGALHFPIIERQWQEKDLPPSSKCLLESSAILVPPPHCK